MRKRLLRKSSRRRAKAEAADFRRIWSDKGTRSPSKEGMSFWRPVPPAGYASLGTRPCCQPSFDGAGHAHRVNGSSSLHCSSDRPAALVHPMIAGPCQPRLRAEPGAQATPSESTPVVQETACQLALIRPPWQRCLPMTLHPWRLPMTSTSSGTTSRAARITPSRCGCPKHLLGTP